MALEQDMRTCSITGLKIHKPAENLIKANAVFAVVTLLLGGVLALVVALTRWPVTARIVDADLFYRALTGHALDMLIAWIIFAQSERIIRLIGVNGSRAFSKVASPLPQ